MSFRYEIEIYIVLRTWLVLVATVLYFPFLSGFACRTADTYFGDAHFGNGSQPSCRAIDVQYQVGNAVLTHLTRCEGTTMCDSSVQRLQKGG